MKGLSDMSRIFRSDKLVNMSTGKLSSVQFRKYSSSRDGKLSRDFSGEPIELLANHNFLNPVKP